MSFKKSSSDVAINKDTWTKNLTRFNQSLRTRSSKFKRMPLSLESLCKMPQEAAVVGRYLTLAEKEKSKSERVEMMCEEATKLWHKLNFPVLSKRSVQRKIDLMMQRYDNYLKRPSVHKEASFLNLLDITQLNGEWLCTEDKQLYLTQLASHGTVGYTTLKAASSQTIHPSKRRKLSHPTTTESVSISSTSVKSGASDEDKESDSSVSHESNRSQKMKRVHHKTKTAVKLVRHGKLSTNKAAIACGLFSEEHKVPTPSQSGIYKALYRDAEHLKEFYKSSLNKEDWSLHFDGKMIDGKEHQVVVLKNEEREVRLAVLILPDSKAATIAQRIQNVLTEYNLWPAIKMIVCDTTAVNTGKKNGVVVRMQKNFQHLNLPRPEYFGCQHHVLDRMLKHVIDQFFMEPTVSPNLEYPFVTNILNNYERLKFKFLEKCTVENMEMEDNPGWRDDMKYLFHLTRVFRNYKRFNKMVRVNFTALPGLSNSRWNSRAIFALLSYILVPESQPQLEEICTFICGKWCDVWFSGQLFRANDFDELQHDVVNYHKASICLKTHWSKTPSPINTARSNICAERAIKIMQDIHPLCRSDMKLNLRFLLSNPR